MENLLGSISSTEMGALGVLLLFILREIKDFVLKFYYRKDREAQARKTDIYVKQIHSRLNFIQIEMGKINRHISPKEGGKK